MISAEGMLFFLLGILSWAVLIAVVLFLLWTLYLLNRYLRLRLVQLRRHEEAARPDP